MAIPFRPHHLLALLILGASLLATVETAECQTFYASFNQGVTADQALGRREPHLGADAPLVPGKFGQGAPAGLVYSAEENVQAGRGTLACWIRVPELPNQFDVRRLIFVQSKERGHWNSLLNIEWQESVFRAQAFDFAHGHGYHDPTGLPAFRADTWHHIALVWDAACGARFLLDGKPIGSTWNEQAWWNLPTPHAIHLSYPNAVYDELYIYDRPLTDEQVADLMRGRAVKLPPEDEPMDQAGRLRRAGSLNIFGAEHLPEVVASAKGSGETTVLHQVRLAEILDDRIPSWKVADGRQNLFWPEWRAPYLGDVDFSGSLLSLKFAPKEQATHLLLQGLVGGCQVRGVRDEYTSQQPMVSVPQGMHFYAAAKLPEQLTGLQIPRCEGMRLQEAIPWRVEQKASGALPAGMVTPLTGLIDASLLGEEKGRELRVRNLPKDRQLFGNTATKGGQPIAVAPLGKLHLVADPNESPVYLDGLRVQLQFIADWQEDLWWLRVQDPVNPQRLLLEAPVRVRNPTPGKPVSIDVTLDFWDIVLDPSSRLRLELVPGQEVNLLASSPSQSQLTLLPGKKEAVLAEFAETQSQLAFSCWQLGSEAGGTKGAHPENPGFALLGSITHNHELRVTLEWIRRFVPDHAPTTNLWNITWGWRDLPETKCQPRLAPAGAPDWAIWGRELLERQRTMAHHWADWQGPDGQVGGGWNDDPCFPGVFIALPLLGDTKTQQMFGRIFDGVEKTGFLHNSVSRSPIDARHATDLIAWRAHMILFDYGEPRHVERALALARELHRWSALDERGHRHFLSSYFSEDGPSFQPNTIVRSGGTTGPSGAGQDSHGSREFLRDPLFAAWYSGNPALKAFVREWAEGDYRRITKEEGSTLGEALISYTTVLDDPKYIQEPLDRLARGRATREMWHRLIRRHTPAAQHPADPKLIGRNVVYNTHDPAPLVAEMQAACDRLEKGWQFRGGEAHGANDHFSVPGQEAMSQMYLGVAMSWLRPVAVAIPPLAVSWENIDDQVAAFVLDASPGRLRVAIYNFQEQPRPVAMRVWELAPGEYRLRQGIDTDGDFASDRQHSERVALLRRAAKLPLMLPPRQVQIVELDLARPLPQPALLPDLAVGVRDVSYDKATDRLKVVIHNLGAAAAAPVAVVFEDPQGRMLFRYQMPRLEAPLDLVPKTHTAWMPQPLLQPVERIVVRIDPAGALEEITRENNQAEFVR